MLSPSINFQRAIFQTEDTVEMLLKDTSDIVPLLKKLFYFEDNAEKQLRNILSEEQKHNQMVFLSIMPWVLPENRALGKEKPIVNEVLRNGTWDRDEDDGYWQVLVFKYR